MAQTLLCLRQTSAGPIVIPAIPAKAILTTTETWMAVFAADFGRTACPSVIGFIGFLGLLSS